MHVITIATATTAAITTFTEANDVKVKLEGDVELNQNTVCACCFLKGSMSNIKGKAHIKGVVE